MKNTISTILRSGITKSKKPMEDYIKYLYPLQYILKTNEFGYVVSNDNKFWKPENIQNRTEFWKDVLSIGRKAIQDSGYFRILNRFENGDSYGIER